MERKQISLEKAVGKTIEGVYRHRFNSESLLISLSDNLFAVVEATYHDYEGTAKFDPHAEFNRNRYNRSDLIAVFGEEQVAERQRDDAYALERTKAAVAAQRRAQYEKLRKEFEGN